MANLTINTRMATGATGVQPVRVRLVDSKGRKVQGYDSTGVVIADVETQTDNTGALTLSMTANSAITAPGGITTYYLVTVGEFSYLITKSGSTQTLQAATVSTP